jgi:hypothetical protein
MAETLIFHWFEVIFHLILIIEGYRAVSGMALTVMNSMFQVS